MKKHIFTLILSLLVVASFAQETPPPVGPNFKQLSTSTFFISLPDSSIWQYKGSTYGWARLARYKDVKGVIDAIGSTNDFVRNQTAVGQTADFRILGSGTFGTTTAGTRINSASVRSSSSSTVYSELNTTSVGVFDGLKGVSVLNDRLSFTQGAGTFQLLPDYSTITSGQTFNLTLPATAGQLALKTEIPDPSLYQLRSEKAAVNGYASLGADGKVPNSQIPALAISETFVVNSQAAMLAITGGDKGDVAVRTDVSKSFILVNTPTSTLSNWQELLSPTDAVSSVNGQVGNVNLTKGDFGLGNVDNTSDLNKPVSTAQQTALDLKAPLNIPLYNVSNNGSGNGRDSLASGIILRHPLSSATGGAMESYSPLWARRDAGWEIQSEPNRHALGSIFNTQKTSSMPVDYYTGFEEGAISWHAFDRDGHIRQQAAMYSKWVNSDHAAGYAKWAVHVNNSGGLGSTLSEFAVYDMDHGATFFQGNDTVPPEARTLKIFGKVEIPRMSGLPSIVGTADMVIDGNSVTDNDVYVNAYSSGKVILGLGGGNTIVGTTTDNGAKLQVTGVASFTGNVSSNPTPTLPDHLTNKNYVDAQTSLVQIDEGNGIGYRVKSANPTYTGNIGLNAVDFGFYNSGTDFGATGLASFVTGNYNKASGNVSTAIGQGNTVTGNIGTAIGIFNAVSSQYGFAQGQGHNVTTEAGVAFGNYSGNGSGQAFVIGNGTNDSNRSNIYKITTSGASTQIGSATATQFILSDLNTAPASSTDTGVKGEIRVTASYIYVCTATNTWVRSALATW